MTILPRKARSWRLVRVAVVAAVLGMSLTACQKSPTASNGAVNDSGAIHTGGSLSVGLANEPATLDPGSDAGFGDAAGFVVARAVLEPLFDLTKQGTLTPALATAVDASPDQKTFTVHLRPGLKFSDGNPLDAQAVIDHYNRLKSVSGSAAPPRFRTDDAGMSAPDATTVVFKLTRSWSAFPATALTEAPALITETKVATALGKEFSRKPVGAGPFKVAEYVPGDHVTVERNANYWQAGKPYLDKIVYHFLRDSQSKLSSLESGVVDLIQGNDPTQVKLAKDAGMMTQTNVGTAPIGIHLQTQRAPMDDVNVRRALSMSIDRAAISKVVFAGLAPPALGLVPDDNAAQQGVPAQTGDIATAKQLIAAYGKPVHFTLMTLPTTDFGNLAQLLQQMWAKIGVTVDIKQVDVAQAFDLVFSKHDYQAFLSNGFDEAVPLDVLSATYTSNSANPTQLTDPRVDAAFDAAAAAPTAADQTAAYTKVLTILAEDVPVIPVLRKVGYFAWNPKVHGIPAADPVGVQIFVSTDLWVSG